MTAMSYSPPASGNDCFFLSGERTDEVGKVDRSQQINTIIFNHVLIQLATNSNGNPSREASVLQ